MGLNWSLVLIFYTWTLIWISGSISLSSVFISDEVKGKRGGEIELSLSYFNFGDSSCQKCDSILTDMNIYTPHIAHSIASICHYGWWFQSYKNIYAQLRLAARLNNLRKQEEKLLKCQKGLFWSLVNFMSLLTAQLPTWIFFSAVTAKEGPVVTGSLSTFLSSSIKI